MDKELLKTLDALYVEDEEVISSIVKRSFSRVFKSVTLAHNGEEGTQMFQTSSYDVVITDVNMPVMNGYDMIENIRKDNHKVIILITTGNTEDNHPLDEYTYRISKPVDIHHLLALICKEFTV